MRAVFGHAAARGGQGRGGAGARPQGADRFFVLLSRAADHSLLWMAIGASLAAGGRRARRGAVRGLAAVAVSSAVTNAVLKPAFRRQRPGHAPALVPRPGSFSFPSGHSASAFAFATAASRQLPGLAPLLIPLAGAVAWSRVRTGVHHRADVLLGSAIGAGLALAVTAELERRHRRRTPRQADAIRACPGQRPRHFVHAATVGLNVRFARIATRGDVRDRLGRFAYLLAAAYAMRKRPAFCCELRYAGTAETMTLTQLSVINAPVFGGPLQLSVPASNPDDRLLDMLAVEDITPGRMLWSGTALLLGARRPVRGIRVWHAPRVHVRADEPLEVTLDGEILGTLPGHFEVAGEALRVITPVDFDDIDD